jgi:hypothetical protein
MFTNNNKIYESWDITPVELPTRSRLYSLEPIGLGTVYTESLSSYILRLANEHCLTPRTLIMGEMAPLVLSDETQSTLIKKNVSTLLSRGDAKPTLNGMREMTQTLVSLLEQLTLRQDLKFLTLLTWTGVLSQRKLLRQYRAWCPQCYQQWQEQGYPIYEPLLWSFREIKICPHHQVALVEKCPHCDARLPAIANFSQLGFCCRCRKWMGSNEFETQFKGNEGERSCYLSHQIGELISITPELTDTISKEDLTKRLQIVLWSLQQATVQDLGRLITFGKIKEQLEIATKRNQNRPLDLVNLIIPTCEITQLSISQLFLTDYRRLSQILSDRLDLGYKF